MLTAITTGVTTAISIVGDVISAIFGTASAEGAGIAGTWSAILPAVGLAVGIFVLITGIGIVKSLIKGY